MQLNAEKKKIREGLYYQPRVLPHAVKLHMYKAFFYEFLLNAEGELFSHEFCLGQDGSFHYMPEKWAPHRFASTPFSPPPGTWRREVITHTFLDPS